MVGMGTKGRTAAVWRPSSFGCSGKGGRVESPGLDRRRIDVAQGWQVSSREAAGAAAPRRTQRRAVRTPPRRERPDRSDTAPRRSWPQPSNTDSYRCGAAFARHPLDRPAYRMPAWDGPRRQLRGCRSHGWRQTPVSRHALIRARQHRLREAESGGRAATESIGPAPWRHLKPYFDHRA